ncbi:MAG: HD domain-containing protein, partial [Actinobacteria bacterium]|nr:HD domain-containing protein [Actinomycetota bacterium]
MEGSGVGEPGAQPSRIELEVVLNRPRLVGGVVDAQPSASEVSVRTGAVARRGSKDSNATRKVDDRSDLGGAPSATGIHIRLHPDHSEVSPRAVLLGRVEGVEAQAGPGRCDDPAPGALEPAVAVLIDESQGPRNARTLPRVELSACRGRKHDGREDEHRNDPDRAGLSPSLNPVLPHLPHSPLRTTSAINLGLGSLSTASHRCYSVHEVSVEKPGGNYREKIERVERDVLSSRAQLASASKGRDVPENEDAMRTCFQRDRDRIVHSKAFRRLAHKTQVFLAPEGDHYRVRLTHTLEVTQVARTIARALRLNEDLVEAVCLGHDLGHTPFGHLGEEVVASWAPGFRHNLQSVRIV